LEIPDGSDDFVAVPERGEARAGRFCSGSNYPAQPRVQGWKLYAKSFVRLALLVYRIFGSGAGALQNSLPTRADAERQVFEDTNSPIPDATDCIYQLCLNDGLNAWSQIDRIRVPVLIINMAGDNMVPVELDHAKKTVARLKNATYIEVKERPELGHGGLNPTISVWGPKLRQWLADTLHP
jgi:homoserine O-acetyltransferase